MGEPGVQGGVGGISANLTDMRTKADLLTGIGGDLLGWSAGVGAIAVNQDLAASLALSPVTGAHAQIQIADGAAKLVLASARLGATGIFLTAAVVAYETVDAALAALAEAEAQVTGFAIGFLLVPLAVGAAAAATVVAVVAGPVVVAIGAAKGAATETVDWLLTGDPVDIQGAMAADLELFTRHVVTPLLAELAERLTLGAPGLVTGLESGRVWGALLLPGGVVMATALLGSGKPLPPTSYADAVGRIISLGQAGGAFQDNAFERVGEGVAPVEPQGLHGVANVFQGQREVGGTGMADVDGDDMKDLAGRIRVVEVPQADGTSAWVIQLPGTQEWGAGESPYLVDVTTDLMLMAEQQTQYELAVLDVMERSGIGADEPVMLTGHSLGGITAASVAASPFVQEHYHVTHVVTGGSPIDRIAVPDDVAVLALQDSRDVVPRLDGYDGTDRPSWTTVTFTDDRAAVKYNDSADAHDYSRYVEGGALVDASGDPSLTAFNDSAAPFFNPATDAKVLDYQYRRVTP